MPKRCYLNCAIWLDERFGELGLAAQWLHIHVASAPSTTIVGVTPLAIERWAHKAIVPASEIDGAVAALIEHGWALVDRASVELLQLDFMDRVVGPASPKTRAALVTQLDAVYSPTLRSAIAERLPFGVVLEGSSDGSSDDLCEGSSDGSSDVRTSSTASVLFSLSSPVTQTGLAVADEEIHSRVDAALRVLGDRDLEAATARGTQVRARSKFLGACVDERRRSDGQRLVELAISNPNWDARRLANAISPPAPRVPEYVPDRLRDATDLGGS